jgi:hypothetical protein
MSPTVNRRMESARSGDLVMRSVWSQSPQVVISVNVLALAAKSNVAPAPLRGGDGDRPLRRGSAGRGATGTDRRAAVQRSRVCEAHDRRGVVRFATNA